MSLGSGGHHYLKEAPWKQWNPNFTPWDVQIVRKGHCLASGPRTMTLKSTAAFGTINHHETQCTWQHEDGIPNPAAHHSCKSSSSLWTHCLPPPCPPHPKCPRGHPFKANTDDFSADWRDATLSPEDTYALLVSLSAKSPVLESAHVCETEDPGQECPELEVTFWLPDSDSEFLHIQCSTSVSS